MRLFGILCLCWGVLMITVGANPSPSKVIDISAASFQLDAETHLLRAKGPVVVRQHSVRVTGDEALYDESKEHVVLTGAVRVVRGPLVMTCSKVVMKGLENWISASGTVEVHYHPSGNVDVLSGSAERVEYHLLDETLDIDGASQFLYGSDRIVGQRLFVDLKTPRFVAEGDAEIVVSRKRLEAL